jgi:hypothetical protein
MEASRAAFVLREVFSECLKEVALRAQAVVDRAYPPKFKSVVA